MRVCERGPCGSCTHTDLLPSVRRQIVLRLCDSVLRSSRVFPVQPGFCPNSDVLLLYVILLFTGLCYPDVLLVYVILMFYWFMLP